MNCKHFMVLCLLPFFVLKEVRAQSTDQPPLRDFDYNRPMFKLTDDQSSNKQAYLRSAVLTGYREGVKSNTVAPLFEIFRDPVTGTAKAGIYNLSIVEMLNTRPIDPRKLILNVKNASKYRYLPEYGDKQDWLRKNAFCFEYTVPEAVVGKSDGSKLLFLNTLAQMLDVKVTIETRPTKTLVLYRTSNIDKIKSKGVNTGANGTMDEKGNFGTSKIGYLGNLLDRAGYPIFVDDTGYKEAIDMDLNISDWKNLNDVRKALQHYDLDLKEEIRPIKGIMVITEINQ